MCITKDEKVEQHLNQHFKNTELNYGQEKMASKRIPRESAVNTSRRQDQVSHDREQNYSTPSLAYWVADDYIMLDYM